MELHDALKHSLAAGRQAAKLLKDNFGNSESYNVSVKNDRSLVTRVDGESQALILSYLKKQFPGVPFVAEEQDKQVNAGVGRDGYYFVVDPLDGTASFVIGIPFFCTSIALCKGPETLVGVIVDPNHNEEFTAVNGRGARLNGNRISVTKRRNIDELYLNVNHTKFDPQRFERINQNILKKIRRFHKLGSLCLEVSYVASGRLDGTINNDLSMWDIAAAGLVLEEAGGRWTSLNGIKPSFPVFEKLDIVATNGLIHDDILRSL
ncbi:MAG: inositol monophosphatase family protein [Nitrososphaera sp.]|uniref:inositol monophosphatase family protein n=1 Tax=Nitrososphaera sp. TaxID=1971748 RepID=UPI003D6FCF44